jgi:hypothetical protein
VNHLPADALEGYVLGVIEGPPALMLEQHVRDCPRCADALAAEARRELALQAMIPRLAPARPSPRTVVPNRWLSPFLLATVSAFALVLVAMDPHGRFGGPFGAPMGWHAGGAVDDQGSPLLCSADRPPDRASLGGGMFGTGMFGAAMCGGPLASAQVGPSPESAASPRRQSMFDETGGFCAAAGRCALQSRPVH